MKAIDYRNETFRDVQSRLSGNRVRVYEAWAKHGPCTTEELSWLSGISILSLRPRTSELMLMGFVKLCEDTRRHGHGGVYVAVSITVAQAAFDIKRKEQSSEQTFFKLKV